MGRRRHSGFKGFNSFPAAAGGGNKKPPAPPPQPVAEKPKLVETVKQKRYLQTHTENLKHSDFAAAPELFACFYDLLIDAERRYDENNFIISKADKKIEDLMHEIEMMPSMNASAGFMKYKELRQARLERRKAKDENKLLYPLKAHITSHPEFKTEIASLKNTLVQISDTLEKRRYEYRLQDGSEQ